MFLFICSDVNITLYYFMETVINYLRRLFLIIITPFKLVVLIVLMNYRYISPDVSCWYLTYNKKFECASYFYNQEGLRILLSHVRVSLMVRLGKHQAFTTDPKVGVRTLHGGSLGQYYIRAIGRLYFCFVLWSVHKRSWTV